MANSPINPIGNLRIESVNLGSKTTDSNGVIPTNIPATSPAVCFTFINYIPLAYRGSNGYWGVIITDLDSNGRIIKQPNITGELKCYMIKEV